jgi:hypothetical protein
MIKGMVTATTSVVYTLGLLMLITYVFAIAVRNLVPAALLTDNECEETFDHPLAAGCIEVMYFSSVPETMHNLIMLATFCDELAAFILPVKVQSTPCLILCWIYIALASLTVMNMLVGVLCEVISAVAVEENESMMVDQVHEKLGEIMEDLDRNHDGTLSWEEFQGILASPDALKVLELVNVDPVSMIDIAEDSFFEDGHPVSITFADFMEMVLDLRGGQEATVEDIMKLGKRFTAKIMTVNRRMNKAEVKMGVVMAETSQLHGKVDQILSCLKK